MPAPAPPVTAELVAGTLGAARPDDGCQAALDAVRAAVHADVVVLTRSVERWTRPVVRHRSPAADRPDVPIDLDSLGGAVEADGPLDVPTDDGVALLVLALRPRDEVPWILALGRPAETPWTAEERATLASVAPVLTLVLEHALLREQLAGRTGESDPGAATRGRFLSLLSHELRNPLAPILMWTSTLRRLRRDDPEVQRATNAIEHAVGLARTLIEEVSDMSRLERGLLELQRRTVDLRDVVRGAVDDARATVAEKQLELVEEIGDEPLPVNGDANRLRQIVGNLVGNVLKFCSGGDTLAVAVAAEDDRAVVRVSDSGAGLPDSLLPQLFAPFVQGPNARGGLGAGLAIAQRIARLHDGAIEAIAHGDRGGATFVLSLPLAS